MSGLKELEKTVNGESATRRPFRVTGIAMQYLYVCRRELWFYLHGIDIDKTTPSIVRGTSVDETTYEDASETIMIDGMIAPDFLEDGRVVEVKPSSVLEEASEMQLSYYLWYLDHFKDKSVDGVLAYPTERKRKEVELTDERRQEVEDAIERVYTVWTRETPPELEKKPYCSSCAYQDFCWG